MKRGIVLVLFLISLVPFVSAENGCCGETVSGDSCVYTVDSNCVTADYFSAGASCEGVSWCGTGCCVTSDGGCGEGAGEYSCALIDGEFFDGQECSAISSCDDVCCQLNSDYSYVSESECSILAEETGIEAVIYDVDSESECYALEREEESGCCVTEEACVASSGADCGTTEFDSSTGYGFYANDACADVSDYLSDEGLEAAETCACANEGAVTCSEDLFFVQSIDSCGNVGDIVDECTYPNEICSMASGTAACVDTSCSYSFAEELDDYNYESLTGIAENTESWCVYEGPAGNYQDRPGSQHYVAYCYAGEILFEACGDYRTEVCVQEEESGLRQADCISNIVESTEDEVTTVPIGHKFWESYDSSDVSASACSGGVVNCNVVMGKSSIDYGYECDANCFCLRKEWSLLMADYCKAQSDCGNDLNLVEQFTDEGFDMKRERESVGSKHQTEVGCGENCVLEDAQSNIWDARGLQCYPGGSLADCRFYTWENIDASYKESLLGRTIGAVYVFTLWEYAGITPSFFTIASESLDTHNDPQYSSIAIYNIVDDALDRPQGSENENIWVLNIPDISPKIPEASADSWEEAVGYYGEAYGGPSDYTAEISYIYGEPFTLNDITEHLATAPEYYDKEKRQEVPVSSVCSPWVAPADGEDCGLCDVAVSEGGIAVDDGQGNIYTGYLCSEYRCKSLGQTCEFIPENQGTGRSTCISIELDTNAPIMSLWKEEMDAQGIEYAYDPETKVVEMENAPIYTSIHFPILTDDYAQCKLSDDSGNLQLLTSGVNTDELYNSLNYIIEDPIAGFSTEHNITYMLSEGDTDYTFNIYCTNYYEQTTLAPFLFKVHTTAEPDTSPPDIDSIYPVSGAQVPYADSSVDVALYLNEYASCKYSTSDLDVYDSMEGEFGTCDSSQGLFEAICQANVPLSEGTTTLYFLCQDQSGNTQTDAEQWYVSKSEALEITQTSPSGTLYTNDITLQVNTGNGGDNGNAVCSYSGESDSLQEMYLSSGTYHEQSLGLDKGEYTFSVSCVDSIGNTAESDITFTVDKDESAAEIESVYYLGSTLYVITNEASNCQWDNEVFSYGGGSDLAGTASTDHTLSISDLTQEYVIVCIDGYGNEMAAFTVDFRYFL